MEADNERLRVENRVLRERVIRLEAELGRDSDNSSKPPSPDGVAARVQRTERRAAEREAAKAGKKRRSSGEQSGEPEPRHSDVSPTPSSCGHRGRGSDCGADLGPFITGINGTAGKAKT